LNSYIWHWKELKVAWKLSGKRTDSKASIVLIHGFGACKEHWRKNQSILGKVAPCYSIDLIGFGSSSQPYSNLTSKSIDKKSFSYNFDNWALQIKNFCEEVICQPVIIIGNSIGGVIALKAAKLLKDSCKNVILINCALRTMDDKRINEQSRLMQSTRPFLKLIVQQRWLSRNIFKSATNTNFIEKVLRKAYPSGNNIDEELINMLYRPTQRLGASEAFHGFINNFDDYLAPELMKDLNIPVDLIWGESDPWEPVVEAKQWANSINCIRSLKVIKGKGHCPHDENPEIVNPILIDLIQQAI